MTPFFLITTPRSGGTLLMRMLDATPGVRCAGESSDLLERLWKLADWPGERAGKHAEEAWPLHRQHAGEGWQAQVAGLLQAWVNPPEGATHYGVRSSFLGREGWPQAVDSWSRLLETWPEAKIIFLGREQGEIELGMLATPWLWRPHYGTCPGVCGGRVKGHLESMQDFHALNPGRTVLLDAEELLDFTLLSEKLGRIGIPLSRAAFESELAVKSGSRHGIKPPPKPVKKAEPQDHPFFRKETTWEDVLKMTARKPGLEVYTLRFGNPPWMAACVPTLESWCKRHGYELKVRAPEPGELDEKFATLAMMREFLAGDAERMLFVDADVMVHPSAPEWPEGGGFRARPDASVKTVADWPLWLEQHAADLAGTDWSYCNSGVWSCDRDAAELFLKEAAGAQAKGYREQHQFNVWWARAVKKGMNFTRLPDEWNLLAGMEERPAWFLHLTGRLDKEKLIKRVRRLGLPHGRVTQQGDLERWMEDPFGDRAEREAIAAWVPEKPWPFMLREPQHARAIVCPWLSGAAVWQEEELRHALRSWERHFTDRECPIYLLADKAPRWLVPGGRVRFLKMDYSRGNERGLREAFATGLQIADEVIWTNDDFLLLKETGWDDLRVALRRGPLGPRAAEFLTARDRWHRTLGTVARDLQKAGVKTVWNFATHTPFLFEREKAVEVLQRFHLRFRGSFETLYYNWHRTPHRWCGRRKTRTLPAPPEARFLNHNDRTLTPELKAGIRELFPEPAAWERQIPKIIHQTWATAEIPREIYPEAWTESWQRLHPEWEHRLWTDADLLELAEAHYPAFVKMLKEARGVVKADLGRLLVLHRHGGLYADLDYMALKPMDELIRGGDLFVSSFEDGYTHNALMAAVPGHAMMLAGAKEALSRWNRAPGMYTEWIAGPELLTWLAAKYDAHRWKEQLVCPVDWRSGRRAKDWLDPAPEFPEAHAVTFWRHNW